MGMFDYVEVEVELPDGWKPIQSRPPAFQTKDFDSVMTTLRITADGRLLVRKSEYESVPDHERPYPNDAGFLGIIGSMRATNERWEDTHFHGIFTFYGSDNHGYDSYTYNNNIRMNREGMILPPPTWHDYEAKFTDGDLVSIKVSESDTNL